uniref:Charged multivesicular body protein 6 n=2 Tax=Neognathae TaxID=8825 RepID=A0A663M5T5_ATHCN
MRTAAVETSSGLLWYLRFGSGCVCSGVAMEIVLSLDCQLENGLKSCWECFCRCLWGGFLCACFSPLVSFNLLFTGEGARACDVSPFSFLFQVQDIEFTQIEMKVIEGLKIGNECLNKMHQVMSIEEVERIIGETQDAVEYQRQIDEILAGGLTEEDEDAILEELNTITQEQMELPEVPSEPLPEQIPGTFPLYSAALASCTQFRAIG